MARTGDTKCGDCYYYSFCEWFIQARRDWVGCDWDPSRFESAADKVLDKMLEVKQ